MKTRTLALSILAALLLVAGAIAVLPTQADEDPTLSVSIVVSQTFPTVKGTVTVLDLAGNAVVGARVTLVSSHDSLPVPAATTTGPTNPSGVFAFNYPAISGAGLPGDHTLTATVTFGADSGSATATYTAP